MSRPLASSRAYGDFVQMSPDPGRPLAVSVRGADELCVAGGGLYGHRITLLKGLPAADGSTLAANADVDFTPGDTPPYVGFAGQGVVLPRDESDGLGIETVNVGKLALEVWRVPDRNLVRKSITAPDPTAEGAYADDYGDGSVGEDGRKVWSGEVVVHAHQGQKATTVFPLGAVLKTMAPGAYVVKARDATGLSPKALKNGPEPGDTPAQARRWVLFTDMGLIAYQGSDGLDVTVRALRSAKPMSGVKLALVAKDGEDLATAQSDAQGRAHFAAPLLKGEAGDHARMVMAYGPNADFTALDLDRSPIDLSKQGGDGRQVESPTAGREAKGDVDGYLYADRGIYRPGETVHLVGLVRDRQARAVKDRAGAVVVRRPSGLEFQRLRFARADGGALAEDIVLPKGAPRGRWRATLEMDGSDQPAGELSFAVEDFAPQRLAVSVAADKDRPLVAGETRRIEIDARFLYGATGAGLQTQTEARLRADPTPFPAFKDFRFGDERQPFQEKLVSLPNSVTDGQGRAYASLDAGQAGDTAQPLAAALTASVFEPGGRPVRETAVLKLRPKPLYLGVKPTQTGASDSPTEIFDIVALNAAGRRVAAPGVTWTLIAENWDYNWFQKDGQWAWRRTSRDTPVARGALDVGAAAPARIVKRLAWGDYRLQLEDSRTGARTVIRLASGWGEPAAGEDAPDTVRLSAGPRTYAQGDTVELAIKAPYGGEAQIAVATDRLIDFKTLSVPKGGTTLRLKTSAAWGGGAYVLASVIQPRDPAVTPKPRRALGLLYVPLDPKGRKLTVQVNAPPKLDASAPVVVPLQVQGLKFGGRAHVTVAAVDEGILRLTHQDNPDPAKWYFGKRALSLDYRDDYGRMLDPNLGPAAGVNFGGDEIGGEGGLSTTPIKTVALWSGVVETGLDGRAKVTLPAAAFNGELRLMAVAWTDDAVGAGASKLTVRRPVVAELALPRFLAPGDQALATLELHNLEGRPGDYTAEVAGQGGPVAAFRRLIALGLGQRIVARAPLSAPPAAGVGRVDLRVFGPGFDQRTAYPIQTRLGWGAVTRVQTALQRPGEAFTPGGELLAGFAPGTASLSVSFSPFQGFDPAPIAEHLSRYPYGCTEQLISTAYPLLFARAVSADPKLRTADAALAQAVSRLLDREPLNGAFGLWRAGDGEAEPWLGAYATDFLLEARARGALVPEEALQRAMTALRAVSKPEGFVASGYRLEYPPTWWAEKDALKAATARLRSRSAAYALYVLAKGGQGDLARLRWFHDVQFKSEPSPLARAQVGAGLALMGDRARAHDSFVQAAQALGFKDEQDWYQTPLRDLAGVIALAYDAGEVAVARELQGRLANAVKDPDALSTQEEARLLQAADRMLRASGPMRVTASGAASAGANRWMVGRLAGARFVNAGGPVWRTVTVRGVPATAPGATAEGLTLTKRLFTLQGQPVNPAQVAQGQRVVILLSGASRQARSALTVIDDPLPAGFEIETPLSPDDAKSGPFRFLGTLSAVSVQEARDDRYVAALTLPGNKPYAVAYVARAVTPGDFLLPGASARDMYRAAVQARTAPGRLHIAAGP